MWRTEVDIRWPPLSLCIIETGSFAEPGVYPFCLTGWSSCSRNLPVCSAGVRFIEARCTVMTKVSGISYITALYFHHTHPSFLSLTPLRSTLISYPLLTFVISSLKKKNKPHIQFVLPILMGVKPFSRVLSPYQGPHSQTNWLISRINQLPVSRQLVGSSWAFLSMKDADLSPSYSCSWIWAKTC